MEKNTHTNAPLKFQIKNRFGGVGRLKGNPFLRDIEKISFFQIAVDKIRIRNTGADKTAVVEIGIVKGTTLNNRPLVVDVYQFRIFKSAVPHPASGKGNKLQITFGKVAVFKTAKVKENQAHKGSGKKAHIKRSLVKVTAEILTVGKIRTFKMNDRGAEILEGTMF
jgi:hypothetical protein